MLSGIFSFGVLRMGKKTMSSLLDRKTRNLEFWRAQEEHIQVRDSLRDAVRSGRTEWESDHYTFVRPSEPQSGRRPVHVHSISELPEWTASSTERLLLATEAAAVNWQRIVVEAVAASLTKDRAGLSVIKASSRTAQPVQRREDYYVPRAYRWVWCALLLLGVTWGTLAGVALATGTLLSPSAVLMGLLAIVVLAATLFVAGSRERIRRRDQ